jgi:hypothetical protein
LKIQLSNHRRFPTFPSFVHLALSVTLPGMRPSTFAVVSNRQATPPHYYRDIALGSLS